MSLRNFLLPLAIAAFIFLIFSNTSQANTSDNHIVLRLLPSQTEVKGGQTITVGLEQTIDEGWHTYWVNPGDSGTAARVSWSGLEGIEAAPIQWPIPKRLPVPPLMNFGYEDNVVLLQDITLPENLPDEPVTLTATVDVLVCEKICIPETHNASFTINGDEDAVPAAIEMAKTKLPLLLNLETKTKEEDGTLSLQVKTDTPQAFSNTDSIELYPVEWGIIDNAQETTAAIDGSTLLLNHPRGDRKLSDVPQSDVLITYTDASGMRKGVVVSALGGIIPDVIPTSIVIDESVGIAKAIILAILGGLILNLMPCVFPVLSMKALSLVQLKDKEIRKARLHGISYTLGILTSFAIIAGILIALKATGAQIGWGFQLQNPAIILALAYLFFALGLNLSGFFEINTGLTNAGQSLTRKDGPSGSFFTGVLATLVATPCTAPFMGVAMGYALTQPALISLSVFLALGFGLALPYLLLTFVPALRHILPKPGAWMERFRQFLAFPMFASACWLVWVLSQQTGDMGVFMSLLGMLAIAFGIWIYKHRAAKGLWKAAAIILSLISFTFVLSTLALNRQITPEEHKASAAAGNWEVFSQETLDNHLATDAPVFVNMTAAWCITCKVNERVALDTESTRNLFAEKKIKYLKGDWTNQNPEITKFLETYGRSGVPIYVYYAPPVNGTRPEPVVLPQVLTSGIVKNHISNH